ncbi:MAG: hypothetical protein MUD16_05795 [Desulfobacterales bacterium]|jgi:hypothetical protein|nr:hypothetical protein [Desulfobacterales bacterium]
MDPVEQVEVTSNPRHWLLAVVMNLLVLAELCVAMYLAAAAPDEFTAVFVKAFFGMLIPTLIAGRFLRRRLQAAPVQAAP